MNTERRRSSSDHGAWKMGTRITKHIVEAILKYLQGIIGHIEPIM